MKGLKFLFILLTIISAAVGLIAFTVAFKTMMAGSMGGKTLVFLLIGVMSFFIVGVNVGLFIRLRNLF